MYDVVIVGGGPAGLSAGLMLGRCRRRVAVLDEGRPRNAVARAFHGYLGSDGLDPQTLLAAGRREIASYGVEWRSAKVIDAQCLPPSPDERFPTRFAVRTDDGQEVHTRKLLFATGLCDELPRFPGAGECYGVTVHHCPYCDGWEHRDEHLLAVGDSARAAAGLGVSLRTWSERITVLTNGALLEEEDQRRLARCAVRCATERIERLVHEGPQLRGVRFASGEVLAADALFFNLGHHAHCDLPQRLGCEFDPDQTVRTSRKQRTNVAGLFLAGDADGDVQFVIVAAAEGATAAVAINRELQEEDRGE